MLHLPVNQGWRLLTFYHLQDVLLSRTELSRTKDRKLINWLFVNFPKELVSTRQNKLKSPRHNKLIFKSSGIEKSDDTPARGSSRGHGNWSTWYRYLALTIEDVSGHQSSIANIVWWNILLLEVWQLCDKEAVPYSTACTDGYPCFIIAE